MRDIDSRDGSAWNRWKVGRVPSQQDTATVLRWGVTRPCRFPKKSRFSFSSIWRRRRLAGAGSLSARAGHTFSKKLREVAGPCQLFVGLIQIRVTRCPYHVNAISNFRPKEVGFVWKKVAIVASLIFCLTSLAFGADVAEAGGKRELDPRLSQYFMTKEREARALAKQLNLQVPPEVWDYFAAGGKEDWAAADRLFDGISRKW